MTDDNAKTIEKPVLRFHPDGHFRILMISDFHGKPDFNPKLTAGIEALVAHTEPDFVMVGGDQLCGIDLQRIRKIEEHLQRERFGETGRFDGT